ncbi:TolC family outer membrane protein [Cereibacter sphaeroides]|uniref:TolC family outer membrane protein n=1 Tax=Cereibacter sphaeroides TaxID=1063 RepID=UPI001F216613|nr:TolC family outer membrane protein [Cereibacter sphaeroides]MCE6960403.1 TolC family outer membrane protein [Cereibacter sphaeroides]MCE6975411.1 TolC family outer membrane protein [Cereibacter sphaeroides]
MRKFRLLAGATCSALAILASTAGQAETLADALISAYRSSNLLDQNRALLRATDEDVAIAVAALRPVVQFVADSRYDFQRVHQSFGDQQVRFNEETLTSTLGITASMTLYDFGRNALAVEAAKENVLATREALVSVEQDVLLDAVDAYVRVQLAQAIVDLRNNNLGLIEQELQAAQDRFDVGEVTRTDVAQAQAALAASQSDLTAAEGDLVVAREAYKAAIGHYPENLAPLPAAPKTAPSVEAARQVALRTHPQVRQAQRQVAAADLNVARAKASMKPTLSGDASAGLDNEGQESASVGLSLRHTLYAGGELSALYRQSLANRDAQKANLLQTGVLVAENVGNAWSTVDVATAAIAAGDEEVRAARTAFEGVREEATLGARTTLDVLNAEQDLLDAQADRLTFEAQRYLGIYQVLASMGLLTVEHLNLGIPTYDPAAYYNAVKHAPATSAQGRKLDRVMQSIGRN